MYEWKNCTFKIAKNLNFNIKSLTLPDHSFSTFVGFNGSGKSVFSKALCGELELLCGRAPEHVNAALVSFEKQMELFEEDFDRRNTDVESDLTGFTPMELFKAVSNDEEEIKKLCASMNFSYALERSIHLLSSGEGRKVLIIEALLKKPELLVLDAPFDGLDVATRADLQDLLCQVYASGVSIAVVVNRFDEISKLCQNVGLIMSLELVKFGPKDEIMADSTVHQLTHYEHLPKICTLPRVPDDCLDDLDRTKPIVEMHEVTVQYDDHVVLNKLNWTVGPYEHWQIAGPNGCGKSTLLSLVTGDNPQGYCNDLHLFGMKRGSGETIWDIKKHIGYVSPSFHLDYRISTPVINVILSGYFDSIGLYEQPGDEKINLAMKWLKLLGLEGSAKAGFKSLSFGQQRLVLIVRALVKQPPLLILDEPLQGLDSMSRELVRRFVEFLMKNGETQVLFVSHHAEDAPNGINNRLTFIDNGTRTFDVKIERNINQA
ncbi:MAG: molybdate ABC transporter ATP-binding protein ModF [Succinivibrionaceae bacterium]|nr:molybdate ABC transporter ATP-binding protein ModF [Succinivibrionaceae bacterium]